jgi:predicted phage tail protein
MMTIMLYGFLGKQFGKVHRYAVSSPAEAVRALCATLPGFKQAVIDGGSYKVLKAGRESVGEEELHYPSSQKETLRIVPVVSGAKNGIGQIILGIVLVAVAIINPAFIGGYAGLIGGLGASLIMGGISQLLYKPTATQSVEKEANKASATFDGAINTVAQGNPVPICYGKLLVGSQVISTGLSVEQLS